MNKPLLQFIQRMHPPLTEEKREQIASFFSEKKFQKNELISKEGQVCNEFYVVTEGVIRSQTFDLEGNDVTTGLIAPMNVACDTYSFFKRVSSKENFYALTDCNVFMITFEQLQTAFHTVPEFREFGRGMLISSYALLKERMLSMLHQTAEERYANLVHSNPDIIQNAPLKHIASYLGVTDTSLSRIRKEFAKK
ncbi:MAG: Crp/Fnr family transcription regulator [Bacteroidetes bacterium]|jgi:CRP-like cAMP-binding protein|nr:Crp/Fnr family transcription regulator [Bacteroidota bacterium]